MKINANDMQEDAYGGFDVVESKATSRLNKICGRKTNPALGIGLERDADVSEPSCDRDRAIFAH